jgi:hypothetical protein
VEWAAGECWLEHGELAKANPDPSSVELDRFIRYAKKETSSTYRCRQVSFLFSSKALMEKDAPVQLEIFGDVGWPPHDRFPYNNRMYQVKGQVEADLLSACSPLLITGYASLNTFLDFLARCASSQAQANPIRLLLGHEPFIHEHQTYASPHIVLSEQIKHYWLEQRISLYHSMKIILAIEWLKSGRLQARIGGEQHPLHAKIYKGDTAITIGSSNFSHSGLIRQMEANVRFCTESRSPLPFGSKYLTKDQADQAFLKEQQVRAEQERFEEACTFAEKFWNDGQPYEQQLQALLESLLQIVGWQEALARACAEVLEGTWVKHYMEQSGLEEGPPLWPSQEQGIAQAMWVIEHVGSVLIADATGSGKTQMGAHLIKAIMNRIWSRGLNRRHDPPVLIAPGGVIDEWNQVSDNAGLALKMYSDALVSRKQAEGYEVMERVIRRAQVLAVDEAHRYHNRKSTRTQQLYHNLADYVVLFTATPVNRGPTDLLRIIDLLGADNFDEDVLAIFDRLPRMQGKPEERLSATDLSVLQQAVKQFTVRRTKAMLNALIDADPTHYQDAFGNPCRYPHHQAHLYPCGDTQRDQQLAEEIRQLASQIRGLEYLKAPLVLPEVFRREGMTEEEYLEWRLHSAQSLARYSVMSALRSSRAALIEHLYGTDEACQWLSFPSGEKKQSTGNMIDKVRHHAGKVVTHGLSCALPAFLTDPSAHAEASRQELALYQQIGEKARHISEQRERTKMNLLLRLQKEHPFLLAFDRTIITLCYFQYVLEHQHLSCPVLLAIGSDDRGQSEVKKALQLGATAKAALALCSESMSEGLNLQRASAVVHLDMPSVVRVAEQRVGRIDRMNSPHATIVSYWPNETAAFALRADQRFYERYQFVTDVLGSNLTLPTLDETQVVSAQTLAEAVGQEDQEPERESWRFISDAFEPVRRLVTGKESLCPAPLYESMRTSQARVLASVSTVQSPTPWAFFAIAGTEWGAPRWIWLDGPHATPETSLEQISQALQEHLGAGKGADRAFDTIAASWLTRFLDRLNRTERRLLSKKKQRALEEMERLLRAYEQDALGRLDTERLLVIQQLLDLFTSTLQEGLSVDWGSLAECWLDVLRPHWYKLLQLPRKRRARPLILSDLYPELLADPLETAQLTRVLQQQLWTKKLDVRVVSAILGVPDERPLSPSA